MILLDCLIKVTAKSPKDFHKTIMKKLAYIFFIALFFFGCATLEDMQTRAQQDPISSDQLAAERRPILEKLDEGKRFSKNRQYNEALESYQQALTMARRLGKEYGIAVSLGNIGIAYTNLGKHNKAIENYQQSLAIYRRLGDEENIASDLNSIGMGYVGLDQYAKAIENFQQALTIARKMGAEDKIAAYLGNIGTVYQSWGQFDKALENHQQALVIARKLGKKISPSTLNNIGLVYKAWGQYDKAIQNFQQALTIARKLGNEYGIATYLNNIGNLYISLSQYDKAIENYQQALTLFRKLGNEHGIATTLGGIGVVYESRRQNDKAIENFQQSLAIYRRLGDEDSISTNLINIGNAYSALGQYDKAIENFQQGLTLLRKQGAEYSISVALFHIGSVYYLQQQYDPAKKYLEESLELIEKLRKTATGNARRDFLASQITAYKLLISLYLQNQEASKAFKVMEESRSRLLAENLIDGKLDFNSIPLESVQYEMKSSSAILSYANSIWPKISLVALTQSDIHGQEISVVDTLKSFLKTYEARIQAMTENQRGIKVVKKDSGQQLLAKVDKKVSLEKTINFYRTLIKNPSPENDKALQEIARVLYDLFIKPIETHISDKKELIIIPDGILGFLPFETLIDSEGRYLVEKYAIRYAQSMTVQQLIKNRQYESDRKPMLALGGAVYDEINYEAEMVTNEKELDFIKNKTFLAMANERSIGDAYASLGVESLSNLPGTLDEINAIRKIVTNSEIISGKEVTEARVKSMSDSGELSQYKVLHFATHGMTVPAFPELSAIVLSQFKEGQGSEDGYLRMGEIAKLKLNADFVNLSACETGLGKIYGGEGIVGLTQSFLLAGAKGISASLWNVSDRSTAMFMVGVYQLVEQKGMSYSRAINEMKRIFIKGQASMDIESSRGIQVIEADETRPEKLSHPYYWGPFVYYGLN
jgi:CHAT domain-containing protein